MDASCSLYDKIRKEYVHRWSSRKCRFDILFGFETPYESLEFSGKIRNYILKEYFMKPSTCTTFYGKRTLRANSWKSDFRVYFLVFTFFCIWFLCVFGMKGECAFPRMLQISLNSDLIMNKKLIEIDIIFHFDAVGHETMVQFKGLSPRGVELFHSYGCTTPVVVCGWAGKENNFNKLGGDVLENILKAIEDPIRIPQYPNTLFLLRWRYMTGILKKKLSAKNTHF